MSRSGYREGEAPWEAALYSGAVRSAIRGKRGQMALRSMRSALEAMPNKVLITGELVEKTGEYCVLGALGASRGIDMARVDPYNYEKLSAIFDMAPAMLREIVYENDEGGWLGETPEKRWERMRNWVSSNLADP